jgi:hypothetical protein
MSKIANSAFRGRLETLGFYYFIFGFLGASNMVGIRHHPAAFGCILVLVVWGVRFWVRRRRLAKEADGPLTRRERRLLATVSFLPAFAFAAAIFAEFAILYFREGEVDVVLIYFLPAPFICVFLINCTCFPFLWR